VKSFILFIVFSNIWVAFCVLALALSSELLLSTINHQISQFVFFSTLFTYNFQRVIRIEKGLNHVRKVWLAKQNIAIYIFMACGGLVSAYRFFEFQLITQVVIVILGLLSVLYPFGLRKIPFSKIFIISFVWTVSTMLLLVLENNIPISQNIVLHLLSRFLFVFAITIPFDIRDLKYDAQNLQTIPLFFGILKAKFIALFSLFICLVISVFQYFGNVIISSNLLALILLYFVASIFIVKSDKKSGEMYFSFWVESLSILCYLFFVISALIF
jgi:4-hydroxybenzoate polyprenyltransferase